MNGIKAVLLTASLLIPSAVAGQRGQGTPEMQFKAAMQAELVDGDLRAAIEAYKAIVSRAGNNRAVVARALLQLAGCYEKLGQADARKVYEQLVRDFTDQAGLVAQARARLATLGRKEPATAPTMQVVTAMPRVDPNNDVQSMSPDGTKALFVHYDKGQNLAVYDFATQEPRLLTHFDWSDSFVYSGIWSPDGRRVAYMQSGWGADDIAELRVAALNGDSRVVFRNEANPGRQLEPAAWLPDGATLLAVLERGDGTSVIGLVPIAGGAFTPLRSWTQRAPQRRPSVSPDGRFVAFAEGAPGAQDVYVLSLDGRTAYRITNHPADDLQPVWSPDGRHLIFLSTRGGDAALWAVTVKDGQPAGEPVRIKDGMRGVNLIDWTTRGLVYVDLLQTRDIYTASVDRTTWQPTADPQLLSYPRTGQNTAPVWSPDGRSLAFISASPAEPNRRHLVVLPAVGGEPREYLIPATSVGPYSLRWFGNGSGLGFAATDRQGQSAVFYLSLATGAWKTLLSPVKAMIRIEWNADGTKLFYAHGALASGSPEIIERDLATDRERTVYTMGDRQGFFRGLRLSPDRRSLAFTTSMIRDGHPAFTVMTVDVETGQARTLMEDSGGTTPETVVVLGTPAWAPDGRALIVPRTVGQNLWPEFRVVPINGGNTRSFSVGSSFMGRAPIGGAEFGPFINEPMWSADGSRMTFVLVTVRMNMWLMQNVLAALKLAKPARR